MKFKWQILRVENFLIFKYINILIHYLLSIKYTKCFFLWKNLTLSIFMLANSNYGRVQTNKVCMISGWRSLQWVYLSIGSN